MPATIAPETGAVLINRLSRLLGERRLSISEASRQSGISYRTLFDLFHDKTTQVHLSTIDKLCRALNCTPNDLFEYAPDPEGDGSGSPALGPEPRGPRSGKMTGSERSREG